MVGAGVRGGHSRWAGSRDSRVSLRVRGFQVRGRGRRPVVRTSRQGPEAGEDLGEQVAAGRQPQGQLAGVADEPSRDRDQAVPEGRDHGFAAADAVTGQDQLAGRGGGELVQPGGHAGREQSAPHPGHVHPGISREEVPQGGAVLAVTEDALDGGAMPVPVLHGDRLIRRSHVQVRQDERVA